LEKVWEVWPVKRASYLSPHKETNNENKLMAEDSKVSYKWAESSIVLFRDKGPRVIRNWIRKMSFIYFACKSGDLTGNKISGKEWSQRLRVWTVTDEFFFRRPRITRYRKRFKLSSTILYDKEGEHLKLILFKNQY
jgi:hypothetical protein